MSSKTHSEHESFRGISTTEAEDKRGAYEMVTQANDRPSTPPSSKEPTSWTLELITLSLSVIFFAAQVALLAWVMNKPYYRVWSAPLSLNTVIAILTTACRASQLHAVGEAIGQMKWVNFKTSPHHLRQFESYDATTRGPRGAVEFILQIKWGLATVGAFVVVLALATDPFTQQVIQLEAENVTTLDGKAVLGFAQGYNTNPPQTAQNSLYNPEIASRDPGIQGAILKGMYNIKTPDEFQCGGACSWTGTYKSLGFSSACQDVKEAAEATKACSKEGSRLLCNYTTPGDVYFSTEYVYTDSATALLVAVNETFMPALRSTSPRVPTDFLKAAVFQSNSAKESSFNDQEIRADNITECTLSLSLHEYSDITANGSELHFSHKAIKLADGWRDPLASPFPPYNITFNQSESGPVDPPFVVSGFDLSSAVFFFKSNSFTSHIISGNALEGRDTDRIGTGAAFLNTDVSPVFSALAESMTDYLRSLSKGPNVELAYGASVEPVVFVRIRWEWLILPIVEELAAFIFVICVIVSNRRHGVPGWKSSALAVLAHNLDDHNILVTKFRGPGELEKEANNVVAQLQ
ncbi:hypothetical protein F4802DRAFT_420117 [Xylaria palmicola]|nr:hypothetical protein F4802DRAFT_420117 [Xylaria palmicola]